MMNHGNVLPPKQTEPKPRLAKDEVELLEREFLKNPKPADTLKRELAEQMAVDVSRINVRAPIKGWLCLPSYTDRPAQNWFQNRRAKAKQMKRAEEFAAQHARDGAASESKSPDGGDDASAHAS
jgi:hypothetical protein